METNYSMSTVFSKKDFNFSCIYKMTSPSGKIYIGQTQCLYKRFQDYRKPKANEYLMNAILKYGLENITVEILEKNVLLDLLDEREQFYLDTLQPFGNIGYNICREASTTRGRKRPPEEMAGSIAYLKSRIGELNHFYGKKHTKETKQKQREVKLGKKQSQETVQKRIEEASKCIKQIDLKTKEFIAEFESITEAENKTGIKQCNISKVANKIKNLRDGETITCSAGNFLWVFCDSEIPNNKIETGRTSMYKKIKQIDLVTNELISEFESIAEASRKTNICSTSIANVVRKAKYKKYGKEYIYKSAGGYFWEEC